MQSDFKVAHQPGNHPPWTCIARKGGVPKVFRSNAVINERYLLRACIVNFHTERHDVEATAEIVACVGRDIDAELRGPKPV